MHSHTKDRSPHLRKTSGVDELVINIVPIGGIVWSISHACILGQTIRASQGLALFPRTLDFRLQQKIWDTFSGSQWAQNNSDSITHWLQHSPAWSGWGWSSLPACSGLLPSEPMPDRAANGLTTPIPSLGAKIRTSLDRTYIICHTLDYTSIKSLNIHDHLCQEFLLGLFYSRESSIQK